MIDSRKFRGSLRRTGIAAAMLATEIIWVLCLPGSVGAQSGFNRLPLSDPLSCPGRGDGGSRHYAFFLGEWLCRV